MQKIIYGIGVILRADHAFKYYGNLYTIKITNGMSVKEAVGQLSKDPGVNEAMPVFIYSMGFQ
jgi:hypothetical protein